MKILNRPLRGMGLAACLCLCLAAPRNSRGAEAPALSLLDLPSALRAAAGVNPSTHPGADDVTLDDVSRVVYAPDGTSVQTMDIVFKVLTEKGRREASTFSLGYNESYGTAEVIAVDVFHDGAPPRSVRLDEQTRTMIDPGQMAENIYDPKQKVLQTGIPGLQTNDVIRIRARMTFTRTRVPNQFFDQSLFEGGSPILHSAYEVHAPRARPLRWLRVRDEHPGTMRYETHEEGDYTVHRWEAAGIPRMYPEPGMPAPHTVAQRVLVSTAESWQDISRWYWNLAKPRMDAVTPEMKQAVEDITRGCATPMERIEALFRFVSHEIRYLGVMAEAEAPGYEPHDVSLTFNQRYGVCRDKCALLASMLRLAGVDAFPVLIMAGPRIDDEVPIPFFNHAITGARVDGRIVLMDPTDENTRAWMPSYLDYCSYLAATPEGDPLRVSPVTPSEKNRVEVATEGEWTADGTLAARTRVEFAGVQETIFRNVFSRMKPAEQRRFFEGVLSVALPGARMEDYRLTPSNLQDSSEPLVAQIRYTSPDARMEGSGVWTPVWPSFVGVMGVVPSMLENTGLARRAYPLKMDFTCATEESIRMKTDGAFGPVQSIPTAVSVEQPEASFSRTWEAEGGVAEIATSLHLRALEYSPDAYGRLKDVLKEMQRSARQRVTFAPAPSAAVNAGAAASAAEANLRVLEHRRDVVVEDAHTWTLREHVRKKVLTYAGMKSASEIEIAFNPAWEEVSIESATVTDPQGRTQQIAERELNLMDAEWTAGAPRYPPERVLVANLPGVRPGSEIAYTTVRTFRDRPFFHLQASFGGFEPVDGVFVRVDVPEALSLQITGAQESPVSFRERVENGRRVLEWTATDLPALPREPDLPPEWACVPTVHVSSGDWRSYAQTLRAALERAAKNQPVASREGRRLARPARTFAGRVQSIRDAVARRIREAGPALDAAPWTAVTPADRTWADGYGNRTDIAVLLHAMLAGAGFEPEFVLAGAAGAELDFSAPRREAPDPGLFDRPLVRVRAPEGGWIYLGDTGEYAPLGATPSEGRALLELGSGRLEKVEVPSAMRTGQSTFYRIELDAAGTARISVREAYRGMRYDEFVGGYRERSPEEQRQFEEEKASQLAHAAVMKGRLRVKIEAATAWAEWDAEVPGFAAADPGRLIARLPGIPPNLLQLRSETRFGPWHLEEAQRDEVTYEIFAPPGCDRLVMIPPRQQWASQAGRIQFRVLDGTRHAGGSGSDSRFVLRVERTIELEPAVFPAADIPRLMEINRELSHPRNETLMIEKTPEAQTGEAALPAAA